MTGCRYCTQLLQKSLFARWCAQAVLTLLSLQLVASPVPQDKSAPSLEGKRTCVNENIRVYRELMDPKNVADVFGRRIAKRYVAIQVTIGNRSEECQYLVHDVSLDVASILGPDELKALKRIQDQRKINRLPRDKRSEAQALMDELNLLEQDPTDPKKKRQLTGEEQRQANQWQRGLDSLLESKGVRSELSSEELSMIRGVAEKGQAQDPRNRILRYLRAAGTIAGGITGVTSFGLSFAASVAAYNGPFITAYTETFPDFTINQLIRLNDSAYVSNRVIPRQQAMVLVAFIPQAIFMTRAQAKQFFKDPLSIKKDIDFRQVEVFVDGNFITELPNLEPLLTAVQIEPTEMKKFEEANPKVKGYILGQNLAGSDIRIKNQKADSGLRARLDGPPEDKHLNFIVESDNPLERGKVLEFEVTKKDVVKSINKQTDHSGQEPVLEDIMEPAKKEIRMSNVSQVIDFKLKGRNFTEDAQVVVSGEEIAPVPGSVKVTGGGTILEVQLKLQADATPSDRKVSVWTASGKSKQDVTLSVKKSGAEQ